MDGGDIPSDGERSSETATPPLAVCRTVQEHDPPFTAAVDVSTVSQRVHVSVHVHVSVQQLPEQQSD